MKLKQIINELKLSESEYSGKTLLIVDIQPAYESGIYFDMTEFCEFLNNESENNRLVFLFNGPELGHEDIHELQHWYFQHGLDESVIYSSKWFDKGYAFFRSCMDQSVDEEEIIRTLKYMWENDITDARDLEEEDWERISDSEDIQEIIDGGDNIWIPDELMALLNGLSNIIVMGGGRHECLAEVVIALEVLDKPYDTYERYIYERQ